MFLRKKKKRSSIDLDKLMVMKELSPATEWVNTLLMYMYRESIRHFTLRKSKGIPLIPLDSDFPDGEISFDKIINRLKVMCGFDPLHFTQEKEEVISLVFAGKSYSVKIRFDDCADDPIYRVHFAMPIKIQS